MGLADVVRAGVAIAASTTKSLQVEIQHWPWIGADVTNMPLFGTPIARSALVEQKQKLLRASTGENVLATTKVTLLDPVKADGATGRREPVDPRDKIVLPDGTEGPIVAVEGLVDPGTNLPYLLEVYLG